MDWITDLAGLPAVVAVLVVFTVCISIIVRTLSKHVIKPFEQMLSNHFQHDMEDREENRRESRLMRKAIEGLAKKIDAWSR